MRTDYDVAILGSGLAGSMLGAILAKHGFKTLLVERKSHPKFTIGESLLPQSAMHFKIIGELYGIPEIAHFSRLESITENISPQCGLKRSLGFVHHTEGQPHNPDTCHLVVPPETGLTRESHVYRSDVDHYMVQVAARYGVTYRDNTNVTDIAFGDDRVTVEIEGGESLSARYIVDATGHNGPVARKLNLRASSDGMRTRSRTIFTHMRGVPAYGDCLSPADSPNLSAGWHEGTLHHLFDGGWMWVIPFNNHPAARSDLCSVGLTLDMNRHPEPEGSPEEEFRAVIARFPGVAKQFAEAEAVRPWVRTGRLQYRAEHAAGRRYCLLGHAYGFVDALYSRGLIISAEAISALAGRLMAALDEDDFDPGRFDHVNRMMAAAIDANDGMVANSYTCFRDFDLWNMWIRVWMFSKLPGDLRLYRAWLKYNKSGDRAFLDGLESDPAPGTACASVPEIQDFINRAGDVVAGVAAGETTPQVATERLLAMFRDDPLALPGDYWTDPSQHHIEFTPDVMKQMILWGKFSAPRTVRANLYDFNPAPLMAVSMNPMAARMVGGLLTAVGKGMARRGHVYE